MKYFMQTICFSPSSHEAFGLEKIGENCYILKEDCSVWTERKLYDLGWGRERGYCRMPNLTFDKLIELAFVTLDDKDSEKKYNYWGSLSLLIDDHCEDLIEYVQKNICKDTSFISKYKHIVDYIDAELNVPDNVIRRISDAKVRNNCIHWKELHFSIEPYLVDPPEKKKESFFSRIFKRK